jgi:hypothetical protein
MLMRMPWVAAAALCACIGGAGCSTAPETADVVAEAPMVNAVRAGAAPAAVAEAAAPLPESNLSAQPAPDRKLIRQGGIEIEVTDLEKAAEAVKQAVQQAGGYLAGERSSEAGGGRRNVGLTCRIPAAQLDAVIARVRGLGRVTDVNLTTSDVTEQYFDLETRLANQKRLEQRLLELLARQAKDLGDILEVERELARVRTEIETLEGRKRLWDNQINFSTLQVTLNEPRPAFAGDEGGTWRTLANAFRQASDNFVFAIAGLIAFAGGALPVVGAAVFVGWLAVRLWRRRRRRSAAPSHD